MGEASKRIYRGWPYDAMPMIQCTCQDGTCTCRLWEKLKPEPTCLPCGCTFWTSSRASDGKAAIMSTDCHVFKQETKRRKPMWRCWGERFYNAVFEDLFNTGEMPLLCASAGPGNNWEEAMERLTGKPYGRY